VDRALGIVAPIADLDTHVLDIFRAVVRVLYETYFPDFLRPRNVGALVEIDQPVVAAMHRRRVEVGMTRVSLDVERLHRRLFHPTIAASELRLAPSRKTQQHQNRERYSEVDFHAEAVLIYVCINTVKNTNPSAKLLSINRVDQQLVACAITFRLQAGPFS
jgi:hypothetical protein